MFGRKPILDGVTARGLLTTLALSLLGLIGWLPTWLASDSVAAPVNLMAWFALAGPAVGCLGGCLRLRFWPLGLVAPALWMGMYSIAAASVLHGAPTPFYAALVWTGLFAAGWAVGVAFPRLGWGGPGALLLISLLLASLSKTVALLGEDASQALVALALDLSPVTCVMESAGLDWMRHASIYDLAGSLPPDVRTPYRGMLAGPLVLLVGWVFNLVAERGSRGRTTTELGTDPSVGS